MSNFNGLRPDMIPVAALFSLTIAKVYAAKPGIGYSLKETSNYSDNSI